VIDVIKLVVSLNSEKRENKELMKEKEKKTYKIILNIWQL